MTADVHWGWLNPERFDGEKMVPHTLLCNCADVCRQTPATEQTVADPVYGSGDLSRCESE